MPAVFAAPAPPTDQMTTYVIMGGACIFIVYTMMRLTKRKTKDPFDVPFQARGLAQHRSVERQMENLLVELSEMSRKMSAQLDTRAAKLEQIIQDADERIARLEALAQHAPPRPSFAMPVETRPVPPEPAVVVKAEHVAAVSTMDPGHAEVYRMADDGRGVAEIASALGRPSGEVELILALRPRG